MQKEIQKHFCNNMEAWIDGGVIIGYVCKVTGKKPKCHGNFVKVDFVDFKDCEHWK